MKRMVDSKIKRWKDNRDRQRYENLVRAVIDVAGDPLTEMSDPTISDRIGSESNLLW